MQLTDGLQSWDGHAAWEHCGMVTTTGGAKVVTFGESGMAFPGVP
jgi:hypothetical protein